MHDLRQDADGEPIARWMRSALQAPVDSSSAQRDAIMARVRRVRALQRVQPPMRASRWSRRGLLNPLSGMAMVAVLVAMVSMRSFEFARGVRSLDTASLVLGDSVVPMTSAGLSHDASSDAISTRLLDTLRIVEFVLRGPDVRSVAVIGDFNGWQRGTTTLLHEGRDRWHARVLVPRDALRFAYVVNETQLVAAPPLPKTTATRRSIPDSI